MNLIPLKKPELVSPAGNLEKLKIALLYGADAAYIGNPIFSLRKYAAGADLQELAQAVDFANTHNKKIYLALNSIAQPGDIKAIERYLKKISKINPHALIIADKGVFVLAKQITPNIPIHISTQANVTNLSTIQYWAHQGAKRVVLAREVTLKNAQTIRRNSDMELEIFVHGAMCAGYSGKCVLSNYTSMRDANRGGCVQNCRHAFTINKNKKTATAHLLNTKDLMAISLIPNLILSQIDALKIEGRMKSNLYVAQTAKAYRQAIDHCFNNIRRKKPIDQTFLNALESDLNKVSNRTFALGGLKARPSATSLNQTHSGYTKKIAYIGTIKEHIKNHALILEVKLGFSHKDTLCLLSFTGKTASLSTKKIYAMDNTPLTQATPNTLIKLPYKKGVSPLQVIYKTC